MILILDSGYPIQVCFELGESILVIGGYEDNLNPVVIYPNEDYSTVFERCQTGKYERRENAVGDFLDDKFIVCGGYGKDDVEKNDCDVIDEIETKTFDIFVNGRVHASSIKLNQSTMWITGGRDSDWENLNSTYLVTVNGSSAGVILLSQ